MNNVTLKYYKNKTSALKHLNNNNILCNREITKYFLLNDYQHFIDMIKTDEKKNFYEYISSSLPINFFYDIEIYDKSYDSNELINICINKVINKVKSIYENIAIKKIILESHSDSKQSYHIILRFIDKDDNKEILFENVKILKSLYKEFDLHKYKLRNKYLIDPSVYRDGLFRTIYSSKNGENRPLIKSDKSDDFDDIETFVCYHTNEYKIFNTNSVVI